MAFFRPTDEQAEACAIRHLNRFRSILILLYVVLWIVLTAWIWTENPQFAGISTVFHQFARVVLPALGLVLILLVHLFSLAVAGVLFKLRFPIYAVCLATLLLGPALTVGFLFIAFTIGA